MHSGDITALDKPKLGCEILRDDINRLLSVRFSKRLVKRIFEFFRHIEKYQNRSKLFDYCETLKRKLVDLHNNHSREDLIKLRSRNAIPGKWTGIAKAFRDLSLRRHGLEGALNVLMIKHLFKHEEATESDYRALSSRFQSRKTSYIYYDETGQPVIPDGLVPLAKTLNGLSGPFKKHKRAFSGYTYDFYMPYPFDHRKVMIERGRREPGYAVSPQMLVESATNLFPEVLLIEYDYFMYLIGERLMPRFDVLETKVKLRALDGQVPLVGLISLLTKDRGDKLRSIANGHPIIQLALAPIHNFLKTLLKSEKTCFCFDQEAGKKRIVEMLSDGDEYTSLDIKSASEHIPLYHILGFLEGIMPEHPFKLSMINVFKLANLAGWEVPLTTKFYIKQNFGSWMGLKSDYYAFGGTLHNWFYLLQMISNDFLIVGDDLFFRASFTEAVLDLFGKTGIPISQGKSYIGYSGVAEFCGTTFVRGIALKRYTKSKTMDASNFMVHARKFGVDRTNNKFNIGLSDEKLEALNFLSEVENEVMVDVLAKPADVPPLNVGGYTTDQLHLMGVINRDEYVVYTALEARVAMSNPGTLQDFLKQVIHIPEVRDRKGKVIEAERYIDPLQTTNLGYDRGTLLDLARQLQEDFVPIPVRAYYEQVSEQLHQRLEQQSVPEIAMLKPIRNDWMAIKALNKTSEKSQLKLNMGIPEEDIFSFEDEIILELFPDADKAQDNCKSTAYAVFKGTSSVSTGIREFTGITETDVEEIAQTEKDIDISNSYRSRLFWLFYGSNFGQVSTVVRTKFVSLVRRMFHWMQKPLW